MGDAVERVAVVTGATGGIGAAVAERLAADGMRVVLCGRRAEQGTDVAARIGRGAEFVRADVGDDADLDALVTQTLDRHGRIDCLVNNAGMPGQPVGLLELDLARFDDVIRVNLRAPLAAVRAVAPAMIEQGAGCIVNIASVSGQRAGYSGHDYSTAKAGLLHLTRSLAVELAAHGIRVNSISPGPIATAIHARGTGGTADDTADPAFERLLPDNQPLPRAGVVQDVARVASFLAGPDSDFVTGQDIAVDGGMSAGRPWRVFEHDWDVIAGNT